MVAEMISLFMVTASPLTLGTANAFSTKIVMDDVDDVDDVDDEMKERKDDRVRSEEEEVMAESVIR